MMMMMMMMMMMIISLQLDMKSWNLQYMQIFFILFYVVHIYMCYI